MGKKEREGGDSELELAKEVMRTDLPEPIFLVLKKEIDGHQPGAGLESSSRTHV